MSSKVFVPFCRTLQLLKPPPSRLQCLSTTSIRYFHGRPRIVDPKTQAKKDSIRDVEIALREVPTIPPYPYGLQSWGNAFQPHPLAGQALLGGAQILSGNKISKGRNKGKTKRKWYPYIQAVKVRSESMDKEFTILATRSCMRTIQKCGGLDEYLLGEKPARLKELGPFGWKLRWLVLNSGSVNMAPLETFEEAMAVPDIRQRLLESQSEAWQDLRRKEERFEQLVKTQWEKKDKDEYTFKEGSTVKNLNPILLDLSDALAKLELDKNAANR